MNGTFSKVLTCFPLVYVKKMRYQKLIERQKKNHEIEKKAPAMQLASQNITI